MTVACTQDALATMYVCDQHPIIRRFFLNYLHTQATIVSHNPDEGVTRIKLPSGTKKQVPSGARAMVGVVAGGGRMDKPLLKAGRAYFKYKAKRKSWPKVRGVAMNVSSPLYASRFLVKQSLLYSLWITLTVVVITSTSVRQLPSEEMHHQVARWVSLLPGELVVSVVPRQPMSKTISKDHKCNKNTLRKQSTRRFYTLSLVCIIIPFEFS